MPSTNDVNLYKEKPMFFWLRRPTICILCFQEWQREEVSKNINNEEGRDEKDIFPV